MDIFNALSEDNRRLTALFDEAVATTYIPLRRAIYEQIRRDLSAQMEAKERLFYGTLNVQQAPRHDINRARKNLGDIRHLLYVLNHTPMTNDDWIERFGDLRRAVAHAIREEESDMFHLGQRYLTPEDKSGMVAHFNALKSEILQSSQALAY